jgi:hypothetical protein
VTLEVILQNNTPRGDNIEEANWNRLIVAGHSLGHNLFISLRTQYKKLRSKLKRRMLPPEIRFRTYKGLNEMNAQTMFHSAGQNHPEEQFFVGSGGNHLGLLLLETVFVRVLQ